MSNYLIRFATLADVDGIMNFIQSHWKPNHILAVDRSFFLYEYQDGNDINFALGIDTMSNEIVGVCGFIKNSKERKGSDIWGSLWKVTKTANPMLGIQILEFIPANTECRTFSSVGIATKTLPIYDFLRFKTNKLNHFYRLQNKEFYQVVNVVEKQIPAYVEDKKFELKRITTFEEINASVFEDKSRFPHKDAWYIEKRYFNHPIYEYAVYAIASESMDSIIVTRTVRHNETKILRIVDYIGDENQLKYLGSAFNQQIEVENYEYIDFYCFGIAPQILEECGFILNENNRKIIIPNYFEPFVAANTDLYFFNNCESDKFYVFKGDGDQDRPSIASPLSI